MLTIKRKVLEVYSFPGTYQGCIYEIKQFDTGNPEIQDAYKSVYVSYELELVSIDHPKQKIKDFSALAVLFLFGYEPLAKETMYFVPFNDLNEVVTKE